MPQHEEQPAALEFVDVSKRFGRARAVHSFALTLEAGELMCLLGPSGCGKTTVLRLAAGLERPDAGSVRMRGEEVSSPQSVVPPERRGLGLVVQDFALFPHLTLGGNVAFGLAKRAARGRNAKRVRETLALVGLEHRVDDWPSMLSGGEQQRLALARALAPEPDVLLLDEPFSSLDIGLRRDIRDETLHLLKVGNATALLVTHDPEEAMFMADRIALMRDGTLEQIGTPEALYFRPKNAFVAGFLGEVNRLPGTITSAGVETPLGTLPNAHDHPLGARVVALVRSEGLELTLEGAGAGAGTGPLAEVITARSLGRTSMIHLSLDAGEGGNFHLHARVHGYLAPAPGTRFHLRPEPERSFVFLAEAAP